MTRSRRPGPRSGSSGGLPRPPEHPGHAEAAEAARSGRPAVWARGPHGWYEVRDRVPGGPRSGRPSGGLPRPPEHPGHAEAAEALHALRELAELAAHPPPVYVRVDLGALVEGANNLVQQLGGGVTLVLVGLLASRRNKRRGRG